MINLQRTSTILLMGDSINDRALPYQALNGVRYEIDSKYMRPFNGSFRRPTFVITAASGSTIANVAAVVAAQLAINRFSHLFVDAGINDAQTGVLLATSLGGVTTICNAAAAAGCPVLWVGPRCFGEKFPTGQNPADAAIDALDNVTTGIPSIVTLNPNNVYVSTRGIYTAQEPLLNLPAPGVTSGILTFGPVAQGLHPNAGYSRLTTPLVMAQINCA